MQKITLPLLASLVVFSCGTYDVEEEENGKDYATTLTPHFPKDTETPPTLTLFIYNQDKQTLEQQEVSTSKLPIPLTLSENNYTLTLCSGLSDTCYGVQQNLLIHKDHHCSPQPLWLGSSDIHPSKNSNLNISLRPCVASLSLSFTGLPPQTEKVTVHVSPVSSSLSLTGEYANDNQSCSISCQPKGETWTAEATYVFPEEESTRTRLSINVFHDGKSEVYSYTYKQPLEAGQPYHFSGSLGESSFIPDADFEIDGWKPGIEIDFDLGQTPGKDEDIEEDKEDDSSHDTPPVTDGLETVYSKYLPTSECLWGNFFVWKVDTVATDEEVIATLISPNQWYLHADEALPALADYEVDGFDGWTTFSAQEAKAFRDQYRQEIYDLNDFIEPYGNDGFKKEGRYLCSQADSTFSFSNNRIIKAGKTVNYYLRGIKKIRVIQK